MHVGAGKVDALIVEPSSTPCTDDRSPWPFPYRPQPSPGGFAVHRPKLLEVSDVDEQEPAGLAEAFFAGVDAHEQAATVWNAHLDESL